MAFESYGAVDVWSSNPAPDTGANYAAAGKLAIAAALGYGGFHLLSQNGADGIRLMDTLAQGARAAGNLSPWQLGNTFRTPEFLFPFTSGENQGLVSGEIRIPKDHLGTYETEDYLSRITGKTRQELNAMGVGVNANMSGEGVDFLTYRETGVGRGSLFASRIVNGSSSNISHELLSDSVMLMSADSEIDPITNAVRKTNRATRGILQALGMYSDPAFSESRLFAAERVAADGTRTWERMPVVPVPSIGGRVETSGDLLRRTSYHRGIAAFEMSRFNDLMGGFFREVGLGGVFKRVLNMSPEVAKGPASSLFMRYGTRMAGLGAAALGVSQTDWLRREYGLPGQALASGLVTGAGMYAAHRLGTNNRLLMMGGLASFAGQMVLPGFNKGILEGISTLGAGADILRAAPVNPFGYYRRTLEGFFPGVSSTEMGILTSVGLLSASYLRLPGTGKRISEHMVEKFGAAALGVVEGAVGTAPDELLSSKDLFYRNLEWNALGNFGSSDWRTMADRRRILSELHEKAGTNPALKRMNATFRFAEDSYRSIMEGSINNGMNKALLSDLEATALKYENGNWLQRNILMNVEGFAKQAYHSFFGADAAWDSEIKGSIKKLGFKGPVGSLGRFSTLAVAGIALQQILTGGLLGSMESMEDTIAMYKGEKLVEVKSSRFWEGGGNPYEGGETEYFRPHAYSLMMNRTRERGIWGEDEDRISPIGKWLRKNFTYELEEKNFYDRPYPVTSAAFQDIPVIGGLLASTIGRLIKPPKLMHADEWARQSDGKTEYLHIFEGSRREPAYSLGAPGPGIPTTEFSSAQQAKFLSYQFRELEGMTGWAKNIVQGLITGEPQWGTAEPVLSSFNDATSNKRMFWEMQMGGAMFSNEIWRRLFPRDMPGVDKENPIRNTMPSWLPDKFHFGDPYTTIEWGEARLPGAGYASLHPELSGIDPADYPLIARYAILADVAPSSYEFRQTQNLLYQRREAGLLSEEQARFIDEKDKQVARVMNQMDFSVADPRAITLPGSETVRGGYQKLWSGIRTVSAPVEYLSPMGFRPIQKLTSQWETPIEAYENTRLYGTDLAFWDEPLRDWIRPSLYSAANMVGMDMKPLWRMEADAVNQKFDELEFNKWMRIADEAEQMGDVKGRKRAIWAASQTRMGVNPNGSALGIYWSLPESERPFFNAFAHAQGKDRERIIEMVPEDQVHLYQSVWSRLDSGDTSLEGNQESSIDEAYLRRQYAASQGEMPPPDWVGWNADVDMDDIKVRYADTYASDLSDYGMWDKQLKKSMEQPMLEGSEEYISSPGAIKAGNISSSIRGIASGMNTAFMRHGTSTSRYTFNDHRDSEMYALVDKLLSPY